MTVAIHVIDVSFMYAPLSSGTPGDQRNAQKDTTKPK